MKLFALFLFIIGAGNTAKAQSISAADIERINSEYASQISIGENVKNKACAEHAIKSLNEHLDVVSLLGKVQSGAAVEASPDSRISVGDAREDSPGNGLGLPTTPKVSGQIMFVRFNVEDKATHDTVFPAAEYFDANCNHLGTTIDPVDFYSKRGMEHLMRDIKADGN